MIRAGSLLPVLCAALAIGTAAAQNTLAPPRLDPVMSVGRIGPISACDSPAAVKALGYPAVELTKYAEGYPYQQLDVDIGQGVMVSATLDQKFGRASPLSTSSPAFVTPTGARVGQTLAELEARYPKHLTFLSEEEGDHFVMLTGETYTSFSFAPEEHRSRLLPLLASPDTRACEELRCTDGEGQRNLVHDELPSVAQNLLIPAAHAGPEPVKAITSSSLTASRRRGPRTREN